MCYDLLIIGNELAGRAGALTAAQWNKRVAVVEPETRFPAESSVWERAVLSRLLRRGELQPHAATPSQPHDQQINGRQPISLQELRRQIAEIVERESRASRSLFERLGIDVYRGAARFLDAYQIAVEQDQTTTLLEADKLLIATGTRAVRPRHIPFDGVRVFETDDLLRLDRIPASLIVVGAGATGIKQAGLLVRLGVEVTLVDGRRNLIADRDRGIVEALLLQQRGERFSLQLGEDVIGVDPHAGESNRVTVWLESGRALSSEAVLFNVGRIGTTENLNLQAAGLEADERGRLWCNDDLQTWVPHIYAAGDVVGFPELSGIAAEEQGDRVASHAFDLPVQAAMRGEAVDSGVCRDRRPAITQV